MKARRSPATDVVLLQHHLGALHLPTIKAECEQVARACATEGIDYLGFLLRLCERELADREHRACQRRLKAAKFPQLKSLDDFDFTAQPSLKRALVLELVRCEFIDRRECVILSGGAGHGQTPASVIHLWSRRYARARSPLPIRAILCMAGFSSWQAWRVCQDTSAIVRSRSPLANSASSPSAAPICPPNRVPNPPS
jgi:hypothetical protein